MSQEFSLSRQVELNFDSNNPFHHAIKKYGESIYLQIIERATAQQQEDIASEIPITEMANAVKQKSLEMFADENLMNGIRLEQDLGL